MLWLRINFLNWRWCCHIRWQEDPGADGNECDKEYQNYYKGSNVLTKDSHIDSQGNT